MYEFGDKISFCQKIKVVHCVRHLATGTIIAKKMIHLEVKPAIKKQIITELRLKWWILL